MPRKLTGKGLVVISLVAYRIIPHHLQCRLGRRHRNSANFCLPCVASLSKGPRSPRARFLHPGRGVKTRRLPDQHPWCCRRFETQPLATMSSPPSARPYRSKRHRPCDQCRARKLGCQTADGFPCQRCRAANLDCTFDNPPPKRARLSGSQSLASPSVDAFQAGTHGEDNGLAEDSSFARGPSASNDLSFPLLDFSHVTVPPPGSAMFSGGRQPTQLVQSIDQLDHGHAQLFGASAESDPWLLRHCRFDDSGMKYFYKVHYRNAGGVPTTSRIPIHFMITSEDLSTAIRQETRAGLDEVTREHLDTLVPPECGRRLVAL